MTVNFVVIVHVLIINSTQFTCAFVMFFFVDYTTHPHWSSVNGMVILPGTIIYIHSML